MQTNPLKNGLWFNPQSLERLSSSGAWSRGLLLYRSQNVLHLDIEPLKDHWLLEGQVQGSQRAPYEVSVEMTLLPDGQLADWLSDCSCPVGADCKHGVALTLKAAYQGLHLLGPELANSAALHAVPSREQAEALRQAALARAEDKARQEAEAQLLQWMQALDRASGRPAEAARTDEQVRSEQYLYLLTVVGDPGPTPRLQLEAMVSYPKVSGGWAKPKSIRTPPHEGQAAYDLASEADRQVLQLMRAMPNSDNFYSAYSVSPRVILAGQAGLLALQQAASTGRLFMNEGRGSPGAAIRWGPPRTLEWHWQELPGAQATGPGWALRARLSPAGTKDTLGATLCLNSPPLYLDAGQGLCGPVDTPGIAPAQLALLLKAPPLRTSALQKHQVNLMGHLGSLPALPLPPVLQDFTRLSGATPTASLHLSLNPTEDVRFMGLIQARLRFDYQGHRGWWAGQGTAVLVDGPQGRVLLQRDAEAELDAITRLFDLGLKATDGGIFGIPGDGPQQDWLHWADNGFTVLRDAGFEVTLDDALARWITHADSLSVQLQPQGDDEASSPWFELSLGMEINGQRHNILPWLPELIAAAAASPPDPATGQPGMPPFVYLPAPGGQGFIRLPTDALKPWMAALLELVGDRAHNFSADSLRLSRLDALRTSAALGEGAVWEGAQALRTTVRQLSGHVQLPVVAAPAGLQASLRPYQQQGLNWLQFLRQHGLSGILADDMGLGKTLQTLAHVLAEKEAGRLTRPALIVAPVSLMGNWRREAERFTPGLRALVLHGKERHDAAAEMSTHDLVIAPYSLLQRDRERWLEQPWHLVVLDEAQNIKNASTHAAQVVSALQTRHRLCLSGTPMENHLGELWSLFHFLMPGFLGSQARFKELFRTPIEKEGDGERLAQLRRRITPFTLRRTKREVATELPDKIESVSSIELSGKQADLYETIRLSTEKTVRDALTSKGLAKSQIQILDALLKLRQVCCDPRLLPLASAKKIRQSAKLEHLMELLPEMVAEGRRVLLFSTFTSMLTLIEEALKARGMPWVKLTGQSQKRDEIIERFTSGEVPLFLISLKAGGVGLNLPQADTVIHYDPWWNPAAENQATDRAHRIGQKSQVFVYKLVAQGTIEERILALQERKAALAESMYSGSQARKQPLFTESDVAELLRPLGT
ncbi:DEAD/DEAH box helicase [Polaromonas jejuensis]|uniref:SNF2-related protein n=1 Tax=Polaromonas jejuensis TaxID=457502 RepID=A0ABW0QEX5_9BURK|nr:DEAD/DEAH box helicase [Polaromonas jejuensis]